MTEPRGQHRSRRGGQALRGVHHPCYRTGAFRAFPLPHFRPIRRLHSEGPARHPRGLSRGEAPVLGRIPGGLQWSERAQLQLLLPLKFGSKQDPQGPPGSLVMPLPCNATAWWTDRLPGHRPTAHLQSGRGSQGPLQGKGKPAAWPFPAGLTARTPWDSRGHSHRTPRLLPGPVPTAGAGALQPSAATGLLLAVLVGCVKGKVGRAASWHRWGLSAALNYSSPHPAGETCPLILFLQRRSLIPLCPDGVPCNVQRARDTMCGPFPTAWKPAPSPSPAGVREGHTHQVEVSASTWKSRVCQAPGPGLPTRATLNVWLTGPCSHITRQWGEDCRTARAPCQPGVSPPHLPVKTENQQNHHRELEGLEGRLNRRLPGGLPGGGGRPKVSRSQ